MKKATASYTALGRALPIVLREVLLTTYSALVTPLGVCWVQYKRGMDILEQVSKGPQTLLKCLEHLSYEKRLRELGVFSLKKRRLWR